MLYIGLKDQTQKIPLRFFIEQLLKKNKIVFTGMVRGEFLNHAHGLPNFIAILLLCEMNINFL